jgi:hypothetical protein
MDRKTEKYASRWADKQKERHTYMMAYRQAGRQNTWWHINYILF